VATVSIVIPNFNHARHLATDVESCFMPDSVPDEVVLVDASTDDSRDVLRELASRCHRLPDRSADWGAL
jgi:glycosyltransferase involved in cell wall biosynthesis